MKNPVITAIHHHPYNDFFQKTFTTSALKKNSQYHFSPGTNLSASGTRGSDLFCYQQEFHQMREVLGQNPHDPNLLGDLLQHMRRTNSKLFNGICQNPSALLKLAEMSESDYG